MTKAVPSPPPARSFQNRAAEIAAWGSLVLALTLLTWRYAFIADASLTYDEATYAELAPHPWYSSYYPDAVFARHPPLYFLFMSAWTALTGFDEALLRLPALLFTAAGTIVAWAAVRRTSDPSQAALAAFLLGTSFLLLVYGIQNTMYPLAFLMASLALWAHVGGRSALERLALTGFALTHLFGFLFIGLWLWKHRRTRRPDLMLFAPALLWIAAATLAVIVARNPVGPASGPAWQALRTFELAYDLYLSPPGALHHAYTFVLSLLLINPVLLESAWMGRKRFTVPAMGGMILVAVLFTGPSFLRYGLLVLPLALILGLSERFPRLGFRRATIVGIAISLSALVSATAYVNTGFHRTAGNDVPGLHDWRGAADFAVEGGYEAVAGPAPTSLSFYVQQRSGFEVLSSRDAPDKIPMGHRDGRNVTIYLASSNDALLGFGGSGALLVVPESWSTAHAALFRAGFAVCAAVDGAYLFLESSSARTACPANDTVELGEATPV